MQKSVKQGRDALKLVPTLFRRFSKELESMWQARAPTPDTMGFPREGRQPFKKRSPV